MEEGRLRICIVAARFAPLVGGAEVRAEKQARQLQALGHDVIVVTLRHFRTWKRAETVDGLPIIRVGGTYKRSGRLRHGRLGHLPVTIGFFLILWRLRHQYDVIHCMQLSPYAFAATLIGKMMHKPVIISIPSTGPSAAQRAALEPGASLMADTLTDTAFLKIDFKHWTAGADDISFLPQLAFGKAMLNYIRASDAYYQILSTRGYTHLSSHGFPVERIVCIPGSVDTDKFQPAANSRPKPEQPERAIICVARLAYAKGIDVLLHAWGRMLHEPKAWRAQLKPKLLIVGAGECQAQLKRMAALLGIEDSVEFMGLQTHVVDLLQRSWGFVLPSRWEGNPNALLEGLACGLPCVATRVSGSEDIITDGVNGLLVEPEQPAEMAQALRRIIEDSDLAQRLGREGRATVVRGYQLTTVVKKCVELYRQLFQNELTISPEVLEDIQ